ncbi:MAG: Lpg1974 family pore-forming outer membrane protein [Rhabdochlamydiaceae bacterium]
MKKWTLLLSPILLMNTALDGWGGRFNNLTATPESGNSSLEMHFPFNSDQGWFVEQSYLLMKPTLGDIEYGNMVSGNGSTTDKDFTIKVKSPEFEWSSGVRLGIGRYLPNHDKWDISFYTTYLYGDTEDHASGNLSQFKALATAYDPFVTILSETTKTVWRLNYFVWDLMLGRQFLMTPEIIFHPYIGLRGTVIYTDFKSSNFGDLTATLQGTTVTVLGKAKVTTKEDFWGIGPRIGTSFDYKFSGNWSFLSNLAASLLYGHYHVKENNKTTLPVTGASTPLTTTSLDNNNAIRVNLEGALGLGWETWFRNNTVRLAPNLQFEGSLWFKMNDFFEPAIAFSQDHGNLGLMGLTFNLQVDF